MTALLLPPGNHALAKVASAKNRPDSSTTRSVAAARAPAAGIATRAVLPVVATVGPGQEGYVHYFVLTAPDGEEEIQVGIEYPGRQIAWSFPGLGVIVQPFMSAGTIDANGVEYAFRHLYGIRPFPDAESLARLQAHLVRRVAYWVDGETGYCDPSSGAECLSCLGFVMHVLFPGPGSGYPRLPDDFRRTSGPYYSTEDLLLYLAGAQQPTRDARARRIASLTVPDNLREDLFRIAGLATPDSAASGGNVAADRDGATVRRFRSADRAVPRKKNPARQL